MPTKLSTMRERENGNDRALWDPLWEYILDDHDSAEEKPRYRLRRQKPLEQERLNTFAFERDSSTDSDIEESWYDSREERNNQRRKSKISASNRRSQLTEDSGVDNSLWGFLAGGEEVSQSKCRPEKVTRRQTRRLIQTEAAPEKTGKKNGLFRRFRRDDKANSGITKEKHKMRSVPVVPPPTAPSTSSKKTQPSPKEESMDPFQMFMEVAAMLDPFGSDESVSEESSDATHVKMEAGRELGSQFYNEDHVSVGELDELTQPTQEVNEIRLNFNPKRTDVDDDVEGVHRNSIEEASAVTIPDEQDECTVVAPSPRAKIDGSSTVVKLNSDSGGNGELQSFQEDTAIAPILDNEAKSSQSPDEIDQSIRDSEMGQKVKNFRLRQLICPAVKSRHDSYAFDTFPVDIAKNNFFATRMVSDNAWDTPKVMNEGASQEHGLGVLPDHFETTKGPQSVYEYDYEQQVHLDVFYTAMGTNPRGTVVVRKLGKPPLLIPSSMRNEVIIQVEVSDRVSFSSFCRFQNLH